jgi:hypothetical protein
MAVTINDRDGRQKILEGLWLIGIEPGQLNVDAGMDGNAFLNQLHANGVNDDFIRRAMAGVEWRSDQVGGTLMQKVADLLTKSGYRPDEIKRFNDLAIGGGNDPQWIQRVLTEQFNDRTAGAMIYKATGGQDVSGAVWNPFRTDLPPKSANVNYGSMGTMATQWTQDPMAGPAGTRVAQPGQLPTPPTPVQQKQQAARAPGAPTISGQVPGAGGPAPGTGGPGAGGTPPPRKLTPAEIRADIEGRYGWAAAFMDIPEIAKILQDAADGKIDAIEANRRWLGSNYYKETSVNERNWRILEKSDPAEARFQMEGHVTSITTRANALGVDLDPARAQQIGDLSKRFGWSDQQIAAAIASEAKYDPTGAKTGIMAQIKGAQQSQLVPLSDQAMTQWAQAIIGGSQTLDDFNAYLKDQAKSLFPSIAGYLDQTPGGNVKTYLDPYAQTISQTLGMPAGDINWMDPKWFRFVNSIDPKTGQRSAVNIADVQKTIIADPQYGFDQTANGKQQKAGFARTILQDWGYLAGSEGGLR